MGSGLTLGVTIVVVSIVVLVVNMFLDAGVVSGGSSAAGGTGVRSRGMRATVATLGRR